jgi:hypothetical protein
MATFGKKTARHTGSGGAPKSQDSQETIGKLPTDLSTMRGLGYEDMTGRCVVCDSG